MNYVKRQTTAQGQSPIQLPVAAASFQEMSRLDISIEQNKKQNKAECTMNPSPMTGESDTPHDTPRPLRSQLKLQRYRYSLDVVTDGSEHTGNGTVFLTVSRPPPTSSTTTTIPSPPTLDQDTLIARYALSGVSTLTSRLAADQSLKLSCTRAVFCPSSRGGGKKQHVSSFTGIPSLLLSLSNYSMNNRLIVVGDGGIESFMEHVADLVLKRRNYPEIVTCVVPLPEKKAFVEGDTWWKVYQDEYIVVYGRMVQEQQGGEQDTLHIVYIVTLVQNGDNHVESCCSFAVFPPGLDSRRCTDALKNLPEEITKSREAFTTVSESSMLQHPLDFILHLNPASVDTTCIRDISSHSNENINSVTLGIHPNIRRSTAMHLVTVPDNLPGCVDEGLLVRSLEQSRMLHSRLSCAFPFQSSSLSSSLPSSCCSLGGLGGSNNKCTRNDEATPLGGDLDRRDELVMAQRLESFTSVILDLSRVAHCQGQESFHAFTMVDRRKCKMDAMARKDQLEKDDNILHSSDGIQDNLHRIQEIASFYYASHNRGTSHFVGEVHDDNEIDLSDGDDESVDSDNDQDCHRDKRHKSLESKDLSLQQSLDRSVPYLLVLGTGCASPAPLRGSSGYAIFMPTIDEVGRPCSILSVVLECGEGYLTMLRRHDFTHGDWNTHLSHIGLIWISHAHLDHYGDLPNLIYEIAQVKGSTRMCTCYNNRQRGKTWIQTPAKNQCNTSIPMPACNRCHGTRPTVVIAPTKVLHYLETALDCKDGFVNGQKVYVGISHRDFDCSPFVQQVRDDIFGFQLPVQVDTHVPVSNNIQRQYRPFQYLKNIQVDHCPNSHGCVLGLNIPVASNNSTKLFTLCYSGDTRPSSNLVRGCQDFTMTVGEPISLLLHEATFDDDARGKEEATSKRHSTVQEALDITSRMKNVDSLLLTHFSQRYPKIPPGHDSKKSGGEPVLRISTNGIQSASAFDGMLIPLKDGLGQILPLITTMATSILSE